MTLAKLKFLVPIAALIVVTGGCKPRQPDQSRTKITPEGRHIVGAAAPYRPSAAVSESRVKSEIRYRRQLAWRVVEDVVREVEIAKRVQDNPDWDPQTTPKLPIWQTWYTIEEYEALFKALWRKQTAEQKRDKVRFCPEDVEAVLKEQPNWDLNSLGYGPFRMKKRLGQLKGLPAIRGIPGWGETFFSPSVIAHYLNNYPLVRACPERRREYGSTKATGDADNFTLCFASEFPNGIDDYEVRSPVDRECANEVHTSRELGTAVGIKANWHKGGGAPLGVFDTSASGIVADLKSGEWERDGEVPDDELVPEKIFTMKVFSNPFQEKNTVWKLAAFHIMSKEIRDWLWISLWWAPDETRDEDFGEDRPASLKGTPWGNYKMCVVGDFKEYDEDLGGKSFAEDYPSLAAAIKAVDAEVGVHGWCSNPYIEQGKGNARTNCIGCHQHGGEDINPDATFSEAMDTGRFPLNGRTKLRRNFPSDYFWSYSHGPDFFEDKTVDMSRTPN